MLVFQIHHQKIQDEKKQFSNEIQIHIFIYLGVSQHKQKSQSHEAIKTHLYGYNRNNTMVTSAYYLLSKITDLGTTQPEFLCFM